MIHIYLMKIVPDARAPAQRNVRLSWHFKHSSSPDFHKEIVGENFQSMKIYTYLSAKQTWRS